MAPLNLNELAEIIFSFLNKKNNPALFAGAGVSVQAGFPSWESLMEHLACVTECYDKEAAAVIRKWTAQKDYVGAATIYKSCRLIPYGEKYEKIAAPFRGQGLTDRIRNLVSLPFSAIFTTNYDRAIHHACATSKGISPETIELNDATMRWAQYNRSFYVARLHGRVEIPDSIVLAREDYQKLDANEYYRDFLKHIFTTYSCLFVGFSFLDPAINYILKMIEEQLSPNYPNLHLALLPSGSGESLAVELKKYNIDSVQYTITDKHEGLWRAIDIVKGKHKKEDSFISKPKSFPLQGIKRFLGTAYARVKLEKDIDPLKDIIIDGIILNILSNARQGELNLEQLTGEVRPYISVTTKQLIPILKRRIEVLSGRGWIQVLDDSIALTKNPTGYMKKDMDVLVSGVMDRLKVREGFKPNYKLENVIEQIIEEILLTRGWDLGAYYAGAQTSSIPDISYSMTSLVKSHFSEKPDAAQNLFVRAIGDLFSNPDETEGLILSELGRIAFALNIILNSPCATVAQHQVLPNKIFLDANFLMPAMVEWHPFHSIYQDAITRLREASTAKNDDAINIIVGKEFLNEIFYHKNIGQRKVEELNLDNRDNLDDYILYQGAENVNVFIGAYANWIANSNENEKFLSFLKKYAPYNSEEELSAYLESKNIKTQQLSFLDEKENGIFIRIKSALEIAYKSDRSNTFDPKENILIEHEARQLARLFIDLQNGLKVIFVTADVRLRRLATGELLGIAGNAIISNRTFIQMVDMILGLKKEGAVLSKLLWGGAMSEDGLLVRDYVINKALKYQDEAMTLTIPEIITRIVDAGVADAKREGIRLSGKGLDDEIARSRFLARIQDRFYSDMARTIDRKYPDDYNFARKARRELLERNYKDNQTKIDRYEDRIKISKDDREVAHIKKMLGDLYKYSTELKSELDAINKNK